MEMAELHSSASGRTTVSRKGRLEQGEVSAYRRHRLSGGVTSNVHVCGAYDDKLANFSRRLSGDGGRFAALSPPITHRGAQAAYPERKRPSRPVRRETDGDRVELLSARRKARYCLKYSRRRPP